MVTSRCAALAACWLQIVLALATLTAMPGCSDDSGPDSQPPSPPPPVGTPHTPSSTGPRVVSISPTSATVGSPDVQLTIEGRNFDFEGHLRTVVVWSVGSRDTILSPSDASETELSVTIPADLLSAPVVAEVSVEDYDLMSDAHLRKQNPVRFAVASSQPLAFETVGEMSTPRSDHAATLLDDGQVLILGGAASAELFDPADHAFVPTGELNVARSGAAAVKLTNGKVLVVGGDLSAETYDPATGAFTPTGHMHEEHGQPTATLLADGRVLVAGGIRVSGVGEALATAELFDPATASFAEAASMISARAEHAASLLPTGEVLIVGGRNGHAPDSADDPPWDPTFVELFDPSSGRFRRSADMGTTRVAGSAATLPDGRVLVLGGFGDDLQNIHEQPANPEFAQLYERPFDGFGPLELPRAFERWFTATPLPDGNVLLIGGTRRGSAVAAVSLLDPKRGALIEMGHLAMPRMRHTATLLKDGRVLVTGGIDSDGNTLATAEISSESIQRDM